MVNRRIGREDSETRETLLKGAEELMREEGYAAVTSRKLARHVGLKPQLVHYYFRTMDELFEALFERSANKHLAEVSKLIDLENPLARLFELGCDTSNAVLHIEFLALANHRKDLQEQIAAYGSKLNRIEAEIIRRVLRDEGIETPAFSPEELSTILETAAHGLSFADMLNPHRFNSARALITHWLTHFGATYRLLSSVGDNERIASNDSDG